MNQDSTTPDSHEEDASQTTQDSSLVSAEDGSTEAEAPVAAADERTASPAASSTRAKSNPADPSAAQLAETRASKWHQDGAALLSIEALREWVNRNGLVLYMPRTSQMSAPAPTLVEATLGQSNAAPSIAESEAARSLLTRLISEGSAVPLNLMGAAGGLGTDVPDYVASAAVFSYVFTLRGNKAWKQAPETQGAVKVSPLALATYEMLASKVTLSAYDLATQLGKEVTETAVLRALTELWSQLRVIPVPQADGSATLWELTSARFTKQIKSGANAGQPSALSALISLYLAQAVLASEDDVETFLSPLAPRSRVRGVVRDLTQARQLETLVIAGKTLLHVGGDLPAFAAPAAAEGEFATAEGADQENESGSRIGKFTGKPGGKLGTGLRAKPFAKPGFGERGGKPAYGKKPAFGSKPGFARPAGDRERRPFDRAERPAFSKPAFDKPWNEDRKRSFAPAPEGEAGAAARPPRAVYPRRDAGAGEGRPPRREFTPREGAGGPRRTFSKPGTFGRKREGFGGAASGDSRPPRRDFGSAGAGSSGDRPQRSGADRSARPSERSGSFSGGAKRTFGPKPSFGERSSGGAGSFSERPAFRPAGSDGEAPRKIYRKFDAPRTKRPFDADRPQRRFDAPRTGESAPSGEGRPSYPKRPGGFSAGPRAGSGSGARSEGGERSGFGSKRPGSFAGKASGGFAGKSDRPERSGPRQPGSFSARPAGAGSGAPRSGAPRSGAPRSGGEGGRPASGGFAAKGGPFAKFADGKKPFRKPGKPSGGKPAGRSSDGGFKPVRRKRPEGGAS